MDKEVRRVLKALDRRGFILEPVKSGTRVFTPPPTANSYKPSTTLRALGSGSCNLGATYDKPDTVGSFRAPFRPGLIPRAGRPQNETLGTKDNQKCVNGSSP